MLVVSPRCYILEPILVEAVRDPEIVVLSVTVLGVPRCNVFGYLTLQEGGLILCLTEGVRMIGLKDPPGLLELYLLEMVADILAMDIIFTRCDGPCHFEIIWGQRCGLAKLMLGSALLSELGRGGDTAITGHMAYFGV